MNNNDIAYTFNIIAATGLAVVLSVAFYFQLVHGELPCPLCLLQRWGMMAMCFGLCLNLKRGLNTRHYAVILFAALFTLGVASRQVMLHILPGDAGYGSPFLGMHLYTWCAVLSLAIIAWCAVVLAYQTDYPNELPAHATLQKMGKLVFWFIVILMGANALSGLLECGLGVCADDPDRYILLSSL